MNQPMNRYVVSTALLVLPAGSVVMLPPDAARRHKHLLRDLGDGFVETTAEIHLLRGQPFGYCGNLPLSMVRDVNPTPSEPVSTPAPVPTPAPTETNPDAPPDTKEESSKDGESAEETPLDPQPDETSESDPDPDSYPDNGGTEGGEASTETNPDAPPSEARARRRNS